MATAVIENRPELTPEKVISDYKTHKLSKARHFSGPSKANRCSVLGHPCLAYCFYDRTVPSNERREIDAGLAAVFDEGKEQERVIQRDLLEMGYDVSQQQGSLEWPAFSITGHKDFKISKNGSPWARCEFKSVNPYTFQVLKTVEDVRTSKTLFVRKWYGQTVLYLVLEGQETYWLFLKNKSNGEIFPIVFQWNDQLAEDAEALLKKAERVNQLIQIGEKPKPEEKLSDPKICTKCEFQTTCLPAINFGKAAEILTGEQAEEVAGMLDEMATLEASADRYEELDKEVKARAKSVTALHIVANDWVLEKTIVEKKAYTVKAQTQTRVTFMKVGKEK